MRPYENLDARKSSHQLFLRIHRATEGWPKREWYGLAAQVRRSAFSVAANIVEGHAKRGRREFRRYLDIAWASYCETRYAIHAATELALLDQQTVAQLARLEEETGKKLWGLIRSIDAGNGRP